MDLRKAEENIRNELAGWDFEFEQRENALIATGARNFNDVDVYGNINLFEDGGFVSIIHIPLAEKVDNIYEILNEMNATSGGIVTMVADDQFLIITTSQLNYLNVDEADVSWLFSIIFTMAQEDETISEDLYKLTGLKLEE